MGEGRNSEIEGKNILSSLEIDTIGEILNISMGSAATAISTMLDKQVIISTPTVEVRQFTSLDYASLEPAMLVKIKYVEGISGSNVMIFRQRDMQIILNLLMGNTEPPTDDFVFDELSMSAACEVMNQMMGASATALSEFLGRVINISTPEASVIDSDESYSQAADVQEGVEIVAVSFQLSITDVMDSSFASILPCSLAKEIVTSVMGDEQDSFAPASSEASRAEQESPAEVKKAPAPAEPEFASNETAAASMHTQPEGGHAEIPYQAPMQPAMSPSLQEPQQYAQQSQPMAYPPNMGYAMPPQGSGQYPGYPPYPMYPAYQMPYPPYQQAPMGADKDAANAKKPEINIQKTQFPYFEPSASVVPNSNGNMDLLMGVPLDVSVEIGKAKRKIRDILDFGQGTVIELNKQAGAPVDIVVNGRLLARGDVVVIDDNFGVRITEIIGTKELIESLKEDML